MNYEQLQQKTMEEFERLELTCCECINVSNEHDSDLRNFILQAQKEAVEWAIKEISESPFSYLYPGTDEYEKGFNEALENQKELYQQILNQINNK